MRILKWLGIVLVGLLVIAAVLAALNWERLVRLNAVNTLFSQDKIVANFSNMNKAFVNVPVPSAGEVVAWQEDPKPLPVMFNSAVGEKNLEAWLKETQTTSFVVIQDGKIAFEEYYLGTKSDDLRISWSVAKSFLSAAFGIAVSEDLIDLEKPVETYVPRLVGTAYEGASVRDVLTMSSGVKFNEDYLDFWSDINKMGRVLAVGGSMDEFAASLNERVRAPGEKRQYVSIDTHVLAMVLRAVTGKKLPEYLAEKIITPIGFEKQPYYLTDSYQNAFALAGLNITTRDYARFGQLFLNNGKWQGKQIIPAGWVVGSTLEQANRPETEDGYGYGYQWWLPDGSVENGGDYQARGIYGQHIYINPKTRTVIVRTAANRLFRKEQGNGKRTDHIHVDMFRAIAFDLANK